MWVVKINNVGPGYQVTVHHCFWFQCNQVKHMFISISLHRCWFVALAWKCTTGLEAAQISLSALCGTIILNYKCNGYLQLWIYPSASLRCATGMCCGTNGANGQRPCAHTNGPSWLCWWRKGGYGSRLWTVQERIEGDWGNSEVYPSASGCYHTFSVQTHSPTFLGSCCVGWYRSGIVLGKPISGQAYLLTRRCLKGDFTEPSWAISPSPQS